MNRKNRDREREISKPKHPNMYLSLSVQVPGVVLLKTDIIDKLTTGLEQDGTHDTQTSCA